MRPSTRLRRRTLRRRQHRRRPRDGLAAKWPASANEAARRCRQQRRWRRWNAGASTTARDAHREEKGAAINGSSSRGATSLSQLRRRKSSRRRSCRRCRTVSRTPSTLIVSSRTARTTKGATSIARVRTLSPSSRRGTRHMCARGGPGRRSGLASGVGKRPVRMLRIASTRPRRPTIELHCTLAQCHCRGRAWPHLVVRGPSFLRLSPPLVQPSGRIHRHDLFLRRLLAHRLPLQRCLL